MPLELLILSRNCWIFMGNKSVNVIAFMTPSRVFNFLDRYWWVVKLWWQRSVITIALHAFNEKWRHLVGNMIIRSCGFKDQTLDVVGMLPSIFWWKPQTAPMYGVGAVLQEASSFRGLFKYSHWSCGTSISIFKYEEGEIGLSGRILNLRAENSFLRTLV